MKLSEMQEMLSKVGDPALDRDGWDEEDGDEGEDDDEYSSSLDYREPWDYEHIPTLRRSNDPDLLALIRKITKTVWEENAGTAEEVEGEAEWRHYAMLMDELQEAINTLQLAVNWVKPIALAQAEAEQAEMEAQD